MGQQFIRTIDDYAMDLRETLINGNRSDVRDQLCAMPQKRALAVLAAMMRHAAELAYEGHRDITLDIYAIMTGDVEPAW